MQKKTRRGLLACIAVGAPLATVGSAMAMTGDGQPQDPVPQGYGACSRCPCRGFEGRGEVCRNCGHNYYSHW